MPVLFAPLFLKGRPPPKGKAAVRPPAHGQSPQSARARQEAQLLATAKADRTRAAGILKQIQAVQKSVANAQKATGKPVKASSDVTKAHRGEHDCGVRIHQGRGGIQGCEHQGQQHPQG